MCYKGTTSLDIFRKKDVNVIYTASSIKKIDFDNLRGTQIRLH